MPPAIVGILLFMVLLRLALRRIGGFLGLNPSEILVIYCMILVAAMISSRGLMEKVLPLLVTTNYYANQSNQWHELYDPHIKDWMVAYDPSGPVMQPVARGYFEGLWQGEEIPWHLWSTPLAAWARSSCSSSSLPVHGQHSEAAVGGDERVSFPLVQLPVEMARPDGPQHLLRNRLLWGGAALPAVVFTLNGLHNMAPSIPQVPLSIFLNTYLVTPPWNQIYWFGIFFSFAAIGFFFLLPTELLFSLWFFALFARFQDVVAGSFGMDIQRMPVYGTHLYVAYQTVGAYFVLAAYLLWAARPHLKKVIASAFGRERVDDSSEMLPYPVAFWGLFGSLALIVLWTWIAGLSPAVALLEFGICLFVVALVLARSTAEAGILMTETSFRPGLYRMLPRCTHWRSEPRSSCPCSIPFLREPRGCSSRLPDGLKSATHQRAEAVQLRLRRGFLAAFWSPAFTSSGALKQGGINLYHTLIRGTPTGRCPSMRHNCGGRPRHARRLLWFGIGAISRVLRICAQPSSGGRSTRSIRARVSWTLSVLVSCLAGVDT